MKLIKLIPVIILFLSAIACIEDTIQVDDLSTEMAFEREIAVPLLKGSLLFDDIAGHGYDSLIITSGDTIFLYLLEDIRLDDTIEIGESGENMEFDFINIHYKITNMFPIGLDLRLYLYNDSIEQNIDTIWFSNTPGELFIDPAPADANGLTIEEDVETKNSYTALTEDLIDKLFNEATRLVIFMEVPSTGGFVKILRYHRLYINLGIEARGRYITDSDSN